MTGCFVQVRHFSLDIVRRSKLKNVCARVQNVVLVFVIHVELLLVLIQISDTFFYKRLRLTGQDCFIDDDGAAENE